MSHLMSVMLSTSVVSEPPVLLVAGRFLWEVWQWWLPSLVPIACGILLALSAATVASSWLILPTVFTRTFCTVRGIMLSRSSRGVEPVMSSSSVGHTPGHLIGTTTLAISLAGIVTHSLAVRDMFLRTTIQPA